ncbi:MAG TPA: pyridoxal-phosphate dependent enzyme, partial [Bryocella sp.]|nr:pyridoxal-phosphate dependent enzyme [Bryocella sp.]
MVNLAQIRGAQKRIEGVAVRTPLIPYFPPANSHSVGQVQLWLKPENLQPIGAFKIRGAFNKIVSLTDVERQRGVITYSSGNHAQGV